MYDQGHSEGIVRFYKSQEEFMKLLPDNIAKGVREENFLYKLIFANPAVRENSIEKELPDMSTRFIVMGLQGPKMLEMLTYVDSSLITLRAFRYLFEELFLENEQVMKYFDAKKVEDYINIDALIECFNNLDNVTIRGVFLETNILLNPEEASTFLMAPPDATDTVQIIEDLKSDLEADLKDVFARIELAVNLFLFIGSALKNKRFPRKTNFAGIGAFVLNLASTQLAYHKDECHVPSIFPPTDTSEEKVRKIVESIVLSNPFLSPHKTCNIDEDFWKNVAAIFLTEATIKEIIEIYPEQANDIARLLYKYSCGSEEVEEKAVSMLMPLITVDEELKKTIKRYMGIDEEEEEEEDEY